MMKKTPAQLKASQKYNLKNKELINKKSLETSKANPEKKKENAKKYREKNKKKIKENAKKYREKNKKEIYAKYREKYLRSKKEKEDCLKNSKIKMFGKKIETKKEVKKNPLAIEDNTPDLVVDRPVENMGMPGFVADPEPIKVEEPTPVPVVTPAPVAVAEPIAAPAPAPVTTSAEQYQIVEVALSATEGLYVYKVITNKYLGELGGVYEA